MAHNSDEIIAKLSNIVLFKSFKDKPEELKKIASIMRPVFFKKDERIINEGDAGDSLYILKSGEVLITKKTLEKEEYTIVKLTGEMNVFFGELALLDEDKRSASIIALTDCELWEIKRKDFFELGEKEPYLCLIITREIAKILASRLRKTSSDIIILFEALVEEIGTD
ncbi:MAG TPA: cyclic nucleotide-binding domain-containing protein [bacterium]|nr:cyclic nucleotide-binding domain-containing protein [bacterium]HOL48031.1 cyclic nucleotide-binding domain-containing protein [bacterium]HPQ19137.1 cyclic nucleotide-binding domain-containing protein [bacterium]